MRNVARFFAFLVAFVIAGASFARAQETPLIGSLDCQVTLGELAAEVIAQPYRKLRCLYLPLHGYPPASKISSGHCPQRALRRWAVAPCGGSTACTRTVRFPERMPGAPVRACWPEASRRNCTRSPMCLAKKSGQIWRSARPV